jgi:hypothetical protein
MDLFLSKHPLSVRYVRGICERHPSANFLRIWSGTKKAALVAARPGVRGSLLLGDASGSTTGAGGNNNWGATAGTANGNAGGNAAGNASPGG